MEDAPVVERRFQKVEASELNGANGSGLWIFLRKLMTLLTFLPFKIWDSKWKANLDALTLADIAIPKGGCHTIRERVC